MLTDDNFARLVAEDVKNRVSTEQADYLRLPENMSRWKRSLQLLLVNLDSQLDELATREELEVRRYQGLGGEGVNLLAEVQTVIEQRRRKVIKFRFHVEKRLDEVIRLSNAVSKDETKQSANYNLLRSAIQKHKELLLDEDFFATLSDADQDLIDEVSMNEPDYPTNTETGSSMQYSGGLDGPKSTGQSTLTGGGIPNLDADRQHSYAEAEEDALHRMMEMAGVKKKEVDEEKTDEGNKFTAGLANDDIKVGDKIPGTNAVKKKDIDEGILASTRALWKKYQD